MNEEKNGGANPPAPHLGELEKTDLKRSTKESYAYLAKRHIGPEFGGETLDAIDYRRVKVWVIVCPWVRERGSGSLLFKV